MNIYIERDYRVIIKSLIDSKKESDKRASFQQLSEEIRVPKSYVSKVMNGRADFSADQIFLCARYFGLDDSQTRYLDLLVDFERSALQNRKNYLAKQIEDLRKPFLDTEQNVSVDPADSLGFDIHEYYLNPVNLIVHQSLSIDRYRLTLPLLYRDLKLSREAVDQSLNDLERLRIIQKQGDSYKVLIDNIHLPSTHSFYPAWRNQMKLLSASSIFQTNPDKNRYFSAFATLNAEGRDFLIKSFYEFLNSVKDRFEPGPDDDVCQINFDFVQWTEPCSDS